MYNNYTFLLNQIFINHFPFYCLNTAASVMEQVAAVLDALSDAKETTRQQVIGLVERIALRLEKVESKNQQLLRENELLKDQLNMVSICTFTSQSVVFYFTYHSSMIHQFSKSILLYENKIVYVILMTMYSSHYNE